MMQQVRLPLQHPAITTIHQSSLFFQATLTPALGLVVVFVEGLSAGDLHPLSVPHTWIACCLEKWIQQKSQQTNAQ